jgi:hypothetical protein
MNTMPQVLVKQRIKKAYSYSDYRLLMAELTATQASTGPLQNEDMAYYTSLNHQRMKRLDKTVKINTTLASLIESIDSPQSWVVLTESWCGDAAQALPVMQKLAELNEVIEFKLLLRDENPDIMDNYLTNCSRSIPKLIIYDEQHEELGTWGPRPLELQTIYDNWRNDPGNVPYKEFNMTLQKWYTADKTKAIQQELEALLKRTVV